MHANRLLHHTPVRPLLMAAIRDHLTASRAGTNHVFTRTRARAKLTHGRELRSFCADPVAVLSHTPLMSCLVWELREPYWVRKVVVVAAPQAAVGFLDQLRQSCTSDAPGSQTPNGRMINFQPSRTTSQEVPSSYDSCIRTVSPADELLRCADLRIPRV